MRLWSKFNAEAWVETKARRLAAPIILVIVVIVLLVRLFVLAVVFAFAFVVVVRLDCAGIVSTGCSEVMKESCCRVSDCLSSPTSFSLSQAEKE